MVYKCKMCGGALEVKEGETTCHCEYCDTIQTVPSKDNEKKMNLFNRANRLRMANEFDKAENVYQGIVSEFPEEAEGYWGLCLCKYGIEYVDDPASGKKIPTCHRTLFNSIFEDNDFDMACEYADQISKRIYREEAKEIDRLQRDVLEIVKNEKPYDIFICYKETNENGERTKDSMLAHDMYDNLTAKGYKVFFARITLEDKLGQEYEPYIFAALTSAKIMLVVGTDYEFFNAVWVKNEWSRFLALMKNDKSKTLIPCYADIDAYDMPQEFKKFQGQDMNKIGFMQDLIRGIGKILPLYDDRTEDIHNQNFTERNLNIENLLKRGFISNDDEDFDLALNYFEKVLDEDAQCAQAYFGIFIAECNLTGNISERLSSNTDLFTNKNLIKAYQFADFEYKNFLEKIFKDAVDLSMKKADKTYKDAYITAKEHIEDRNCADIAAKVFEKLGEYKDSKDLLNRYKDYEENLQNIIRIEKEREEQKKIETERLSLVLSKLHEDKKALQEFVKLKKDYEYFLKNKADSEKELIDYDKRKKELINEYQSLGLFSIDRKKEISEEYEKISEMINKNINDIEKLEEKLTVISKKLKSYQSISDMSFRNIEDRISQTTKELDELSK